MERSTEYNKITPMSTSANTRASLSFAPLELNLARTWTTARNTSNQKKNGLLTIRCDGVTGLGEAAPNVRYGQSYDSAAAAFERITAAVEGLDPMEHRAWIARAVAVAGKDLEVVAALDMALLDWKGKKLGVSVADLLGIPRDPRRMPVTSYSIGLDTPEAVRAKVREAARFPILKIKVGTAQDEAMIDAVREVTQKTLRVDANEGWRSVSEALERISALAARGVEFVEQPLPASDMPGLEALAERSALPVFADESSRTIHDIHRCSSAFHGVNIKLSKCGGITPALDMIAAARAAGLKVMIGCMIESSLSIAAGIAVAPLCDVVDLDGNLLIAQDPFSGLEIEGGRWALPGRPGLGVDWSVDGPARAE